MPTSAPSNIKACIFDAFGTLFNLSFPLDQIDQLTGGQGQTLMDIWRSKQLEYTWLRSLMQHYVPFDQVTREALDFAMAAVHCQDPMLPSLLLPIYEQAQCFPAVPAMLRDLREKGITTAILSNGTPSMLKAGAQNARIDALLGHIFSVESIGIFKPAPQVYQYALDQLALSAEEVLFFSSNQWDVIGASRFGLPSVWVDQHRQTRESLTPHARYVLKDLSELISFLHANSKR
ncbi:MAG: haloacid dehalogenase type II [Bacteroidota bacterium]